MSMLPLYKARKSLNNEMVFLHRRLQQDHPEQSKQGVSRVLSLSSCTIRQIEVKKIRQIICKTNRHQNKVSPRLTITLHNAEHF
jgi:DNA-directed RNA polymerase sigma subunit (sigma70/sigma32)